MTNHRRLSFQSVLVILLQMLAVLLLFSDGNNEYSNNSSGGGIGLLFALGFTSTRIVASRPLAVQDYAYDTLSRTLAFREKHGHGTTASTTTKLDALPLLPGGGNLELLNGGEEELAVHRLRALLFWITTFASSHIGMSAIRQILITNVFGQFLANDILGIVGDDSRLKIRLPDFWSVALRFDLFYGAEMFCEYLCFWCLFVAFC